MTKTLIKDRVYAILEKYPETRNCDATLVARYWQLHEVQHLDERKSFMKTEYSEVAQEFVGEKTVLEYSLPLFRLNKMTSPSTIERWRRHIQNKDGRFWPTDPAVASRRRMSMKEWKERMIAAIPDTL